MVAIGPETAGNDMNRLDRVEDVSGESDSLAHGAST
jgi:hypothetical protein